MEVSLLRSDIVEYGNSVEEPSVVVASACNPSIWEAGAEASAVQSQEGLPDTPPQAISV